MCVCVCVRVCVCVCVCVYARVHIYHNKVKEATNLRVGNIQRVPRRKMKKDYDVILLN